MSLQEKFDLLLAQERKNQKKEKVITISNVYLTNKDVKKYRNKNIIIK